MLNNGDDEKGMEAWVLPTEAIDTALGDISRYELR
jgi:hypothetical protein